MKPRSSLRAAALVTFLIVVALGLSTFWRRDDRSAEDPVWLNTAPEVAYIGSEACADCHPLIAESFAKHSMGRSAALVRATSQGPAEGSESTSFRLKSGAFLAVRESEGSVYHEAYEVDSEGRRIPELSRSIRVECEIGSGERGKTFLYDREGYLFESPISWFRQKGGHWDLSPGYASTLERAFDRPIVQDCLYCHIGRSHHRPGTINGYEEPKFSEVAIGCERCHGPGSLHRELHLRDDDVAMPDHTIVNPSHLDARLRDNVCEQCHLKGKARVPRMGKSLSDYRPGLSLDDYLRVFVASIDSDGAHSNDAVSHFEQMRNSRCFIASDGAMGCVSCHDPHELPPEDEKPDYFRQRCLACHGEATGPECARPLETDHERPADGNCVACHMPKNGLADIVHTAESDHSIPREAPAPSEVPGSIEELPSLRLCVYPDQDQITGKEERRDLAVAAAWLWRDHPDRRLEIQKPALEINEKAARDWPEDVLTLFGYGVLLDSEGALERAEETYVKAQSLAPLNPISMTELSKIHERRMQLDRAIDDARLAAQCPPASAKRWTRLATILAKAQRWDEAREACERSLDVDPLDWPARIMLVRCLVLLGRVDDAERQANLFERADSPDREMVRRWVDGLRDAGK